MHAKAHPARFLAAHQHLTGQHLGGDVLEAHRHLDHFPSQVFGHQGHQIGAADGLDHRSGQGSCPGQVVDEQGHQQLGAAETPVLINGGDAVAIAIEDNAHRRLTRGGAGPHGGDQFGQIGGQRLGRMAAEERVAVGADLPDHARIHRRGSQQGRQHPGRRAVHRIDDHPQPQPLQPRRQRIRIDLGPQARHVGAHGIELFRVAGDRHADAAGGQAPLHPGGEIPLHRAAEGSLDLEPQPFRWVMAGGDHQGAEGTALHHRPAGGGGGGGAGRKHGLKIGAAHRRGDRRSQLRGQKAAVVADHNLAAGEALRGRGLQLPRRRRRHRQQPLHGDVHAEDAAPAVGAEGDRAGLQRQGRGGHGTRGYNSGGMVQYPGAPARRHGAGLSAGHRAH